MLYLLENQHRISLSMEDDILNVLNTIQTKIKSTTIFSL